MQTVGDSSRRVEPAPDSDRLGLVGSVVDGRYLIERLVGRGGFGFVYRATHLRFDSKVALKVLNVPPQASRAERERFFARFAEEGRLAFSLGALHPGIVRVFEAGTLETSLLEPTPYLAMEWLEGRSLREFLEDRAASGLSALGVGEVLELLEPAVQGLAAAHRARVAHCDVKPANVFLSLHDGQRTAKVLDFGLAQVVAEGVLASQSTASGVEAHGFTFAYAAPEQWVPRLGHTGPWTDVHALALLCVELLCGRRALSGNDPRQLMAACLDESRRPTPAALGLELGAALERVFDKALGVSPKTRFRSAGEFWAAFRQAAASVDRLPPPPAVAPSAHGGGAPSLHDPATTTAPTRAPARARQQSRVALLPLILPVLGALWLARSWLLAGAEQPPERLPPGAADRRPPSAPVPAAATRPKTPAPRASSLVTAATAASKPFTPRTARRPPEPPPLERSELRAVPPTASGSKELPSQASFEPLEPAREPSPAATAALPVEPMSSKLDHVIRAPALTTRK